MWPMSTAHRDRSSPSQLSRIRSPTARTMYGMTSGSRTSAVTSPRSRSLRAVIPNAVIRPRRVAPIAAAMPIQKLRFSESISSVFENALWNHFVVKPDQGNVCTKLSSKAKMIITASGA